MSKIIIEPATSLLAGRLMPMPSGEGIEYVVRMPSIMQVKEMTTALRDEFQYNQLQLPYQLRDGGWYWSADQSYQHYHNLADHRLGQALHATRRSAYRSGQALLQVKHMTNQLEYLRIAHDMLISRLGAMSAQDAADQCIPL